jgi:hypothetical protein
MNAKRFCSRCEKMVPKIGVRACVPVAKSSPHAPVRNAEPVTNNPTHGITHGPTRKTELRKAQTYRWRERYPDRWKRYHAEYMRTWRRKRAAEGLARG